MLKYTLLATLITAYSLVQGQEIPLFPACEDGLGHFKSQEKCSEAMMFQYIYSNLVYPLEALAEGVEGRAILQFDVTEEGTVENINIIVDPGYGIGESAAAVIKKMNMDGIIWTPAHKDGKPKRALYTLPIHYSLTLSCGLNQKLKNGKVHHAKVQYKPLFPGCAADLNDEDLIDCSKGLIQDYIQENIKYPIAAKKNKLEDIVIIEFVVTKEGLLENIAVVKGKYNSLNKAAYNLIEKMSWDNKWEPGEQDGSYVDVLYYLPIEFKIKR